MGAPGRVLGPEAVERVRAYAAGLAVPPEPRPAASVVLLRGDGARPADLGVYLLTRHDRMPFAAGMAVFPGGAVDPRDAEGWSQALWAGPPPAWWGGRLGEPAPRAQAVVSAAIRETFEETGVLLAGSSPSDLVGEVEDQAWEADRRSLVANEQTLPGLLARRGLVARTDLLAPVSCWVTPVVEPRRYRTWFFLADLPPGQHAREVSEESASARWWGLGEALDAAASRTVAMMPPQRHTLAALYAARSGLPGAHASADGPEEGPVEVVEPAVREEGDRARLVLPPHLVELVERVDAHRAGVP